MIGMELKDGNDDGIGGELKFNFENSFIIASYFNIRIKTKINVRNHHK